VVAGGSRRLLAYRVGPDVRSLLLVAGTVDTHPLCKRSKESGGFGRFRCAGEDRLLVGLHDA
jgi:hypothetical protein